MAKKDIDLEKQDAAQTKSKKAKKDKPVNEDGRFKRFFKGIAKWFRDLRSEFKKVVWPSKKTVVTNTAVVLVVMLIAAAFVGGLDAGLLKLAELALNGKS